MHTQYKFPESFLLLQQEGYLISTCLTTGLSEFRSATIQDKGRFYSALLNLSIGIERFLKSIIIIDFMIENSLTVPTKIKLKKYGHDIHELLKSTSEIAIRRRVKFEKINHADYISIKIIALLNDFALTTRYYNLNALSAGTSNRDPLDYINEIYTDILNNDVSKYQQEKIAFKAASISAVIEESSFTIARGLDKKQLSSTEYIMLPFLNEQTSKYIVFRIIELLNPLYELIKNLSLEAYNLNQELPPFPQMQEFFYWLHNDKRRILNKKKWP